MAAEGQRLVRSIKKGEQDLRSADWCIQLSWHAPGTGCMFGTERKRLSVALLGTLDQRQGNTGGNCERDTGGRGNGGCEGDEGF